MTRKLLWSDPYGTADEATGTSVNGLEIATDCTTFFAFSGGQGAIGGFRVQSARRNGLEVVYIPGSRSVAEVVPKGASK